MFNAAVGLCIDHNLTWATKKALKQAQIALETQPSLILYFTGSHSGGTKTYNDAMKIIIKLQQKLR